MKKSKRCVVPDCLAKVIGVHRRSSTTCDATCARARRNEMTREEQLLFEMEQHDAHSRKEARHGHKRPLKYT